MVGDLVVARDLLHEAGDHVLRQRHLRVIAPARRHQVVDVRVRHVELARGELGVVRQVDRLVAELTAQLVHAVQTTDHQLLRLTRLTRPHLQVQLGSDTHVEVQVEVVVVRDERLRRGASRLHVHHGRLHLQETEVVQVAADLPRRQVEGATWT